MPCDAGLGRRDDCGGVKYDLDVARNQLGIATKKADEATRAACIALALLEAHGHSVPQEIAEWWEVHQREDAERKAKEDRERRRADLIDSLTEDQRDLLGL